MPKGGTNKKTKEIDMTAHTTASLAASLETTPRELRKFLRAEGAGVGKGSRYSLDLNKREVDQLRKGYDAWAAARAAKVIADEAPADEVIDEG
jgi:hypothetical protein